MWQQWYDAQAGSTPSPDLSEQRRAFLDATLEGMAALPKAIPQKFLMDDEGARLFDAICEVEAYYLDRAETDLLARYGREIAEIIPNDFRLVQLGSATARKTRALLDAVSQKVGTYVPVDLCKQHLFATAARLARLYPSIRVMPLAADYEKELTIHGAPARTCIYVSGTALSSLSPLFAQALLKRLKNVAGPKGSVLVAVDLKKSPSVLRTAFDDAQGVTAAMNKNLLLRMNRELEADFDVSNFWHHAAYSPQLSRVEMHLVSKMRQSVVVYGHPFLLDEGESIMTSVSYKYGEQEFATLARCAGWQTRRTFVDEKSGFALFQLAPILASLSQEVTYS